MSKEYWEQRHAALFLKNSMLSDSVSRHAVEVETLFHSNSEVLDLGCGTGFDSRYFALKGHNVEALDGSRTVINYCQETHCDIPNVSFREHDLAENLKFKESLFDVVYARLSLHYFSDSITKEIFKEIARVLRPGGFLVFLCKSPKDPLYGIGDMIEQDFYSNQGHVRHFFSPEYCRQLCKDDFAIESLASVKEKLFGKPSAYVHVVAQKFAKQD